jgi:hypothetical protein
VIELDASAAVAEALLVDEADQPLQRRQRVRLL